MGTESPYGGFPFLYDTPVSPAAQRQFSVGETPIKAKLFLFGQKFDPNILFIKIHQQPFGYW
jgi:hypothetical protein